MKCKILFSLVSVLSGLFAFAQEQPDAPRFNGADVQYFMGRLVGEFGKVVEERQIAAETLTPQVAVAFVVRADGSVGEWRFRDRSCEGRDRYDVDPASETTREALTEAFSRLDGWSPATYADGRTTDYTLRLVLRLPVEKYLRAQEPDPLLFQGRDPRESFTEWMRERVHYDARYAKVGGVVRVKFYIEPTGRVVIGEVLQSPDEQLTKEVLRAIRASKGKWTPRKVDGVPQRTAYEFHCNYVNDGY